MMPGYDTYPATPSIAAEAVGGAIAATLYDRVATQGPHDLLELAPLTTFVALAPFLGTEKAAGLAVSPRAPSEAV